jgi:hypothetical protein
MSTSAVVIYQTGLSYCSVCAPNRYTAEMVAEAVNKEMPTGIDHPWKVSAEETFKTGESNPCPCNDSAADRQHWLLVC